MAGVSFEIVAQMDQAMSTVKSGTDKIASWVDNMGKKSVPWDEMLTGALDPAAIIGAITTLFGSALLSVGSFQVAMQNSSADSASSIGDNLGAATSAAETLSETTGISAGDAATTLNELASSWTNTSMQSAIATDSATLAASGLGNASDIAGQFSNVLKTFGITDAPTANIAMQELYTAARNSGMSFSDFMNTIISNGPALVANGQTIQGSANALSSLATQSGMTAETAKEAFSSISQSLADPTSGANMLLRSVQGVQSDLASGNLSGALQAIVDKFKTLNTTTVAWGQAANLNLPIMDSFHNVATTSLTGITDKTKTLADTEKTLGDNLDAPLTQTGKLAMAANEVATKWEMITTPMVTDFLTKFVEPSLAGVQHLMDAFSTTNWTKVVDGLTGLFCVSFNDIDNMINKTMDSSIQKSNEALLNVVLGESNVRGNLGSIGNIGELISTAESSNDTNMLSELIDALKTGSTSNLSNISNQLNIGTINAKGQSPQQIEQALYSALYTKFQQG